MKKIIYGLGTITTMLLPATAAISCGKNQAQRNELTALKNLASQVTKVNSKLAWTDVKQPGNVGETVTVLTLSHAETVNFFKELGLLKSSDETKAAAVRVKSETRTEATTETPTGVTAAQVTVAKAFPFQKAIEAFLKTNTDWKIDKFLKDQYNKNIANTKGLKLGMLDAQFHAEGYGLDSTPAAVDGKTQGHGGYSYLSFKIKYENTNTEAFRSAFTGANKLQGEQLVQFNDTVKAITKAFNDLAAKTGEELKALPEK